MSVGRMLPSLMWPSLRGAEHYFVASNHKHDAVILNVELPLSFSALFIALRSFDSRCMSRGVDVGKQLGATFKFGIADVTSLIAIREVQWKKND